MVVAPVWCRTDLTEPNKGSAPGAAGVTKAEELAEKGIEVTALETGAGEVQEGQDDDEEAEDLVVRVLAIGFHAFSFLLQFCCCSSVYLAVSVQPRISCRYTS